MKKRSPQGPLISFSRKKNENQKSGRREGEEKKRDVVVFLWFGFCLGGAGSKGRTGPELLGENRGLNIYAGGLSRPKSDGQERGWGRETPEERREIIGSQKKKKKNQIKGLSFPPMGEEKTSNSK